MQTAREWFEEQVRRQRERNARRDRAVAMAVVLGDFSELEALEAERGSEG